MLCAIIATTVRNVIYVPHSNVSEEFFLENKRLKAQTSNVVTFMPNGDYYYNKALKALDRDEMDKAYKYIKRAAELSPDDAHVLLQYGILEMEIQQFEHAYELIHTAYSLEPSESETVFMLAEISGCMGIMSDAQKYANQYLSMDPDGMYALEAVEILEFVDLNDDGFESLDEHDSEKLVAQEKARRLMEQGDFKQAIQVLEETIEHYPQLWNAYNNLALAYFYIGEAEQAKALLNEVLRENHGNLHAICNLTVFAYYEREDDKLQQFLDILKKIQPYDWDDRYKIGATLALVGQYEEAFKWLNSMRKRGHEGDPGFYFWLAQSAYFSGQEQIAQNAWKTLIEMDPTKDGFEPWADSDKVKFRNSAENQREFIVRKLTEKDTHGRMLGLFLLKISAHKQEIIAHPVLLDVSNYNNLEKLSLAYALDYDFNEKAKDERNFLRLMAVAEHVAAKHESISIEVAQMLSTWMALGEMAFSKGYQFKNIAALGGALEYTYSASMEMHVTKKDTAEKYGISVSTLSKYVDVLYGFVPVDFE